ncbi:hypothetical protein GmHk_12G034615 [Glycine max]|nr:hypothetical protein GmHk_12G034615 [Glycine max]
MGPTRLQPERKSVSRFRSEVAKGRGYCFGEEVADEVERFEAGEGGEARRNVAGEVEVLERGGMGPTRLFWERSRTTRLRHTAATTAERVELMRLVVRLRVVRETMRQRMAGKGPEREAEGRLTAVMVAVRGSQVTPRHRHGLAAEESQEERAFSGSESYRLASKRKRLSWVRERESAGEERESRGTAKQTRKSCQRSERYFG